MILLAAPLAADFDRRHETRGLATLFLLLSIGGVFLTVPDTEEILVLLGAAAPVVILAWPRAFASSGFGLYPLVGILMWVIAWGGRGREGSIVGAAACLGVLVIEPLAVAFSRRSRSPGALSLGLLHGALVFVAARIAGVGDDPRAAVMIASVALAAGAIGWWSVSRGTSREYVP
jgi:hypothetical protein